MNDKGQSDQQGPRYEKIANELLGEIEAGHHKIGSLLPTEAQLCDRFGCSRYTVREALRLLFETGIIARRRGAGTIVLATRRPPTFNQTLESLNDVLQYARGTRLSIIEMRSIKPGTGLVPEANGHNKTDWVEIMGLRYAQEDPRPLALTRIFANTEISALREGLAYGANAIVDLIENNIGINVARIDQTITALCLNTAGARHLKTESGTAAMRVLRHYLSGDGRVVHIAESLHPSDRFSLSMTFDRDTLT